MVETDAKRDARKSVAAPSLGQALTIFLKIGVLSFGGPAAQISLMHRELVDANRWLSEKQFLNALSFCMLLPGPEAMQLATYAGWRLHGVIGGLVAGLLFVLPGAAVILALSVVYAFYGAVPLVAALFLGVKAAVLIIVLEALLKVSKRALTGVGHWAIAGLAFIGIFFLAIPFPIIVLAAAAYGFVVGAKHAPSDGEVGVAVSPGRTLGTVLLWLAIWMVPLFVIDATAGTAILGQIGAFFSKLAVVTFGGAYAVLAYMAQDVVTQFGWLTAGEMMDGLGLAETTPGPLILVTQFVGFLAAFGEGGFALGLAGAAVTLWATFAPCFLWIFAGAPYIEWISAQPRLSGALTAITAAVVGVILNLSLWFALHIFFADVTRESLGLLTLWTPDLGTIDWRAPVLSAICAVLLLRLRWGIGPVLGVAAALGWAVSQIG
ncbi:MAG: chromate efflux transporter [Alphaproteobacteria bacterium]|nr:chromate efflux transporter [Alphaproteobacteria bacterium]